MPARLVHTRPSMVRVGTCGSAASSSAAASVTGVLAGWMATAAAIALVPWRRPGTATAIRTRVLRRGAAGRGAVPVLESAYRLSMAKRGTATAGGVVMRGSLPVGAAGLAGSGCGSGGARQGLAVLMEQVDELGRLGVAGSGPGAEGVRPWCAECAGAAYGLAV